MPESKEASTTIVGQQADLRARLPFSDTQDFEDANRGLIVPNEKPVVAPNGRVLWDNSTYDFLTGDARASSSTRSSRTCTPVQR